MHNDLKAFSDKIVDTISAFRFRDESRVLTTVDFVSKYTQDPRPRFSHKSFSFDGHEYQRDLLMDMAHNQCVMKCSQIGASEGLLRKAVTLVALHGLNVGYVLPELTMVQEMTPTRIDPIINMSKHLSSMVRGANNTRVKQFRNGAALFIKYSSSPTATISTPLDAVFLDEFDQYDPDAADAWPQRLGHSDFKIDIRFSTPTVDGLGVASLYDTSDQREYMVRCSACGHWQTMRFPESILFEDGLIGLPEFFIEMPERVGIDKLDWKAKYLDRKPYIGCLKCSAKLDRGPVFREWVAKYPTRSLSGRRISRFDIVTHTAVTIIDDFFAVKRLRQFYNQVLGLPHSSDADQITLRAILDASALPSSGFTSFLSSSALPTYLGIDQAKRLHLTFLQPIGRTVRVVNVATLSMVDGDKSTFVLNTLVETIYRLCIQYRVHRIVCDAAPDINLPRALAEKLPGRVYWCYFKDTVDGFTVPSDEQRVFNVNRTWMLGSVDQMIRRGHDRYQLLFPYALTATTAGTELAQHLQAMVKLEFESKTTEGTRRVRTVWMTKTSQADHYFLSTGYAFTAMELARVTGAGLGLSSAYVENVVVNAPGFV